MTLDTTISPIPAVAGGVLWFAGWAVLRLRAIRIAVREKRGDSVSLYMSFRWMLESDRPWTRTARFAIGWVLMWPPLIVLVVSLQSR